MPLFTSSYFHNSCLDFLLSSGDESSLVAEWRNCDLFDAAGVPCDTFPTSADEYVDLAKTLTLDGDGNNAHSDDFDPDNVVQWGTAIAWYRPQFLTDAGTEQYDLGG